MTTTRLCKYHGRACEFPGACLNQAPRKYEGDGHLERIDAERLQVGCVVRMPYRSGGVSAYSDCTVTRIYVKSWKDSRDDTSYDNLHEALEAHKKSKDTYVWVKLSRPYLYANTIGCVANWLVGVETYEVEGARLLDTHKVVVQSTGEYANHNAR